MALAQNAALQNCYKCGYEARTHLHQCPQCGQRLRSSTEIRWLGVVLLLIGIFLAGVGGALFVFVGFLVAQAGRPGSGIKVPAAHGGVIFLLMFGIFALLIALGVTSVTAGLWQIMFGRRSKLLAYLFVGLVILTFAVGSITTVLIE